MKKLILILIIIKIKKQQEMLFSTKIINNYHGKNFLKSIKEYKNNFIINYFLNLEDYNSKAKN